MAIEKKDGELVYIMEVGEPDMTAERAKAIATIVVTAIVNVVNIYGYSVDMDSTVNTVLTIVSFACILWSWWKNQNITEPAGQAQLLLTELKKGQHLKKELEEVAENGADGNGPAA